MPDEIREKVEQLQAVLQQRKDILDLIQKIGGFPALVADTNRLTGQLQAYLELYPELQNSG